MNTGAPARHLPLHAQHAGLGPKWGQFGDWEVPLYYSSILEEHEAVRTRAGIFDISHMGEILIEGARAGAFLDEMLPRNVSSVKDGKAVYNPLLNERGTILDDIIVYKFSSERFYLIVNADNSEKDYQWLRSHAGPRVGVQNITEDYGLLAVQGPAAKEIVAAIFPDFPVAELRYYEFLLAKDILIARTGYTGEDGFELMIPVSLLTSCWQRILEAGKQAGLKPCGFGARDTLRLEAAMPLYGHDMNEDTTPWEAGLGWAVDMTKPSFMGKDALAAVKQKGIASKLAGFKMVERGIPRQGQLIFKDAREAGHVTSGSFSPTLKANIGLGYLPLELAAPGNQIDIQIRNQNIKAEVVPLPFYKRKK